MAAQITFVWSFTSVRNQMYPKRGLDFKISNNYDEENKANTKSNIHKLYNLKKQYLKSYCLNMVINNNIG